MSFNTQFWMPNVIGNLDRRLTIRCKAVLKVTAEKVKAEKVKAVVTTKRLWSTKRHKTNQTSDIGGVMLLATYRPT
jgi:hypothetical protein